MTKINGREIDYVRIACPYCGSHNLDLIYSTTGFFCRDCGFSAELSVAIPIIVYKTDDSKESGIK